MEIINIVFFVIVVLGVVIVSHLFINIRIKDGAKFALGLLVFIIFCFFIFLVVRYFQVIGNPFTNSGTADRAALLGSLGDYFGGLLNPLFAFLGLIGVLWTIHDGQKSQTFQKFENLFTNLISELSNKINYLYPCKVEEINKKLFGEFDTNVNKRQLIIDDHNFSVFFIFLYQLLKHIDTSLSDEITKKKYANIVRSLIPDEILQLLMINCFLDTEEHNFDKYKDLIEKFEFFEHVSLYDDSSLLKTSLLLNVATYYNFKAFGQNRAFANFSKNLIFEEVKKNNNLVEILRNVALNSIEVNRLPFNVGEMHSLFHIIDNDDCPHIASVWISQKQCFTHLNLLNQRVEKIRIDLNKIYLFSTIYKNGIGISLEKDSSGKVLIPRKNIREYLMPII